jgi:hypothetical protein
MLDAIAEGVLPYILESNPHSVFGDFLNGKNASL